MRAFRLLLMLSLLFTGAAGAGESRMQAADCDHAHKMAAADGEHGHEAHDGAMSQDCDCEAEIRCTEDCGMNACGCAVSFGSAAAAQARPTEMAGPGIRPQPLAFASWRKAPPSGPFRPPATVSR